MSGIQDAILLTLQAKLQIVMIDALEEGDPTRAGVVKIGDLQGDPDPDQARISITLFVNDPDQELGGNQLGVSGSEWDDQIEETEIGGGIVWRRRFTVKARCLMVNSREDATTSRSIATQVKQRIEKTILSMNYGGVAVDNEFVCRGAFGDSVRSEMLFSGGPPDSYDYHIKIRFDVLTSEMIGVN
ncbi:MAG: hypothetical protein KQI81_08970 [Deltaproteobacteria bacterium]|nr:hypothetical protein [Deltaproteobacteria bacterium]